MNKLRTIEHVNVSIAGVYHALTALVYSRGGTMSPESIYFLKDGKRITPYEQHRIGVSITLGGLFKIAYSEALGTLYREGNLFLRGIEVDKLWGGAVYPSVKVD